MTIKKEIINGVEQIVLCIVIAILTIAFFQTESGTMWAIGLLCFILSLYCFIKFCDTVLSVYIALTFLNKTLKD